MMQNVYVWQPLETAPEGIALALEVSGDDGAAYVLPFACVPQGADFFNRTGKKLEVIPLRWKTFTERKKASINPRYVEDKPLAPQGPAGPNRVNRGGG